MRVFLSAVLQAIYTGNAWISVGFSTDGLMIGSDAVIGLPDDGSVMEYDMASKVRSTSVFRAGDVIRY